MRGSPQTTRISILSAASVLLIILALGRADGETFYVDAVRGSDISTGLSEETAWHTLSQAADRLKPGDTLIVLSGRYRERVKVRKSGAPGAPITIEARGSVITQGFTVEADHVTIKGFEITDTEDHWKHGTGVFVKGKHCLIADNFVHDVSRVGIQVFAEDPDSPETCHCRVLNNRIVRAGLAGIEVYGRDNLVEGNQISQTLQFPAQWSDPPKWADADGIHFFGSGHRIRRNFVHDICLTSPENVNPHIDAIQTFGPAYDIVIEGNLFTIPDPGMQIAMIEQIRKPVRDILVVNNAFINTFRGLNIWNRGKAPLRGIQVVHNTFFKIENYAIEFHGCDQVTVANNVFYDVGSHRKPYVVFDRTTNPQLDHNCHSMSDGRPPAGRPAENDLWQVNPRLANVKGGNFRPLPTSPLIDAGRMLDYVNGDAIGNSRPFGSAPDIGAYEFVDVSQP